MNETDECKQESERTALDGTFWGGGGGFRGKKTLEWKQGVTNCRTISEKGQPPLNVPGEELEVHCWPVAHCRMVTRTVGPAHRSFILPPLALY